MHSGRLNSHSAIMTQLMCFDTSALAAHVLRLSKCSVFKSI